MEQLALPVEISVDLRSPRRPERLDARPVRWVRTRRFNLLPPAMRQPQRRSGLRVLGMTIVVIGFMCSAIAAWYLWGTGILTAGEQARLAEEFQHRLATAESLVLPESPEQDDGAEIVEQVTVPVAWDNPVISADNGLEPQLEAIPTLEGLVVEAPPDLGEPLGRIVIEKADVDWIVSEGVTPSILRGGPGHMPGTAMPGRVGNTVISGHRTTNGAPFYHLDRLDIGDAISIETISGTHTYEVVHVAVVTPDQVWVATQWDTGSWLTLTTCTPRYSSSQRLIVFAQLVDGPNAEVIHGRFGSSPPFPGSPNT